MLQGPEVQFAGMVPLAAVSDSDFLAEIGSHLPFVYPPGEGVSKSVKSVKDAASPVDAAANAALAGKAAVAGTRAAGKAVSLATSRVKLPLIAGGSAAAGLAGGLAVIHRRRNAR